MLRFHVKLFAESGPRTFVREKCRSAFSTVMRAGVSQDGENKISCVYAGGFRCAIATLQHQ